MEQKGSKQLVLGCILALLLVPASLFSQNNTQKWGVSASAMGGYVWAHKGPVYNLKAHIYGGSVGYRFKTANLRQWQRIFNSPTYGVDYFYAYLGTPNILGSVHAVIPYIEFPIAKGKRLDFNIKAGIGVGYITKPFELTTNVSNRTIGSHLNGNMSLHGTLNYFVSSSTEINFKYGLTHFSNGNFKMPNLGVNLPDAFLGFTYYWGQRKIETPKPNDIDTSKTIIRLSAAFANKVTDYIFPHRVIVGIFQFNYWRSLSLKSKLGGGIDLYYDPGNYYTDNRTGQAKRGSVDKAMELGIKVSHVLQGHKGGFISEIGYYLYNKNNVKGPIYQRLGVQYLVTQKMGVYTALKVHFARADYFEFGINYRINKQ